MGNTAWCDKCKTKDGEEHPCGDTLGQIGEVKTDTGYHRGKEDFELCDHCIEMLRLWINKKPSKKECDELNEYYKEQQENAPEHYD